MSRPEFRIDPPLRVRAGMRRSLDSIEDAIAFLSTWAGRRPGPDWGDVLSLLQSVRTQEQVAGATNALRMLLESRALLVTDSGDPDHAAIPAGSGDRRYGS
jgi:hypothetical protein